MALSQELLELLVCPVEKGRLTVVQGGAGLRCQQCRRIYPVRDDIPIMLVEEATLDAADSGHGAG